MEVKTRHKGQFSAPWEIQPSYPENLDCFRYQIFIKNLLTLESYRAIFTRN